MKDAPRVTSWAGGKGPGASAVSGYGQEADGVAESPEACANVHSEAGPGGLISQRGTDSTSVHPGPKAPGAEAR